MVTELKSENQPNASAPKSSQNPRRQRLMRIALHPHFPYFGLLTCFGMGIFISFQNFYIPPEDELSRSSLHEGASAVSPRSVSSRSVSSRSVPDGVSEAPKVFHNFQTIRAVAQEASAQFSALSDDLWNTPPEIKVKAQASDTEENGN